MTSSRSTTREVSGPNISKEELFIVSVAPAFMDAITVSAINNFLYIIFVITNYGAKVNFLCKSGNPYLWGFIILYPFYYLRRNTCNNSVRRHILCNDTAGCYNTM